MPNGMPNIRLARAFFYSLDGLRAAFRAEQAVRLEIALILIAIPLALWIGHTALERVLLIGSLMLVLIIELINTAIERTVDRISTDRHDLSKQAKDAGSAAVLISLLLAAISWGAILWF